MENLALSEIKGQTANELEREIVERKGLVIPIVTAMFLRRS